MKTARASAIMAATLASAGVSSAQDLPHVNLYWTTPGGQTRLQPGESTVLSLWATWDAPVWPAFGAGTFNISLGGWDTSDSFATHRDWSFGTEDNGGPGFFGRRDSDSTFDTLRFSPSPGEQQYVLLDGGGGAARIEGRHADGDTIDLWSSMSQQWSVPAIQPIEVFRLGYVAGDGERELTLGSEFVYVALRHEYLDPFGWTEATFTDALITLQIIPAPAGFAVLGLAGLIATRRRR